MSLKTNIISNYLSQFYVTLIGIAMVPLYIKYMGAEAYGLIGFFAMLQAWFNLLDMGLSTTMARETARFSGGATDAINYRQIVRALEILFFSVALVGGLSLFSAASLIAGNWLKATALPFGEIQRAVELMAIIIAMRWLCGLYRGAVSGAERFALLGVFNSGIATLRFVAVLPILIFVGATPTIFFGFQAVAAVIELLGLILIAYRLLPRISKGQRPSFNLTSLRPVLKFSLTVAFTSSAWVFVTQTDKLVLSSVLPLAEYGYFTLAVLLASGVMLIGAPISNSIIPRLAKLEAAGDHTGLIQLYRQATQFVVVIAGSVSVTLAFFAEPMLWIWTGDRVLAERAAPILSLYALGNGVLVASAFPYYLQYAKGDLSLHLVGNAIFVILLIPTVIWAATQHGAVGAGFAWLGINAVSFFAWLPLVHRKFEPNLNAKWYGQDVLAIVVPLVITGSLFSIIRLNDARWAALIEVVLIGGAVILSGIVASSVFRTRIMGALKLYRP